MVNLYDGNNDDQRDDHSDCDDYDSYEEVDPEVLFPGYDKTYMYYDYFGRLLGPPAIPEVIVCPFCRLGERSTSVIEPPLLSGGVYSVRHFPLEEPFH